LLRNAQHLASLSDVRDTEAAPSSALPAGYA
jgi:hypothetical protein